MAQIYADEFYPAIALPIWISLVCYTLAMARWFRPGNQGWSDAAARCLWVLSCGLYLLHVIAAFHYFYGWSHQAAYNYTAAQSGFGPGIYVTYAFTGMWLADAVWAWLAAPSYAARPAGITWTVHLVTAFMLFNGAVIFAHGFSRGLGIGVTVVVGTVLLRSAASPATVSPQRAQGGEEAR
jgi:hypothetical protein